MNPDPVNDPCGQARGGEEQHDIYYPEQHERHDEFAVKNDCRALCVSEIVKIMGALRAAGLFFSGFPGGQYYAGIGGVDEHP